MSFGLLNVHSHYSLLRGVAKVPALVAAAKAQGVSALALTDTNNLYGAIEFYKTCEKEGIRPILGVTLSVRIPDSASLFPLVLLAENLTGYRELLELVSFAHFSEGTAPHITREHLASCSHVIALLPALYNPVLEALDAHQLSVAEERISFFKSLFGDRLYAGISPQNRTPAGATTLADTTTAYISFLREHNVARIPLPLVYLLSENDTEARGVLLRIQHLARSAAEEGVFEDPLLIPDVAALTAWAEEVCPESLATLSSLLERCSVSLELGVWEFPTPPLPEGSDPSAILWGHIEDGYRLRHLEKTKELEDRVAFEMEVIVSRGYANYFLSVIDFITYMRSNGILNATRGSAAGSLVSYLIGITNVNPIEYQLPFERFLNPFRPSPPDIDLDIADNKRSEVIDYITERFGKKKVAQIGTLGTMMARAAVRDTARGLGYSYMNGDRIAKLIPLGVQGAPMYIDTALAEVPELKELYKTNETAQHIITVAKKIEGNARHLSVHAAGVVIAPDRVVHYTPLERDPKGVSKRPITQYNMHAVEDAGLLKFDILGLTNLAILADALRLVKQDTGECVLIDEVSLDDKKTYEMISHGLTIGIFQLGGRGMTAVLKRMRPTSLYDLAATIALYRPGPMKNIDEYIARKHGDSPISYLHPTMEKYLSRSYGVLVYQDDLLYTAIELAGYDWKEVDVFRKAVGKKIPELMAEQEKIFKERVKKRTDLSDRKVEELWSLFDPFKGYGFNKAHAMSYAKIAYQTAYMKANYPAQYMAAHLSAVMGDVVSVSELVYEAKRIELCILSPEINTSIVSFSTERTEESKQHNAIRIGFEGIKGVGSSVAEAIVSERERGGAFTSLEDFFIRFAPYKLLNRRNLEGLIKAGVFSSFEDHSLLLENLELLLRCAKDAVDDKEQHALFDTRSSINLSLSPAKEQLSSVQILSWEKQLLGVYVSGHPLDFFSCKGLTLGDVKRKESSTRILTTAVIEGIKPFRNKSGERMYFVTLEDNKNEKLEAVCFPKEAVAYEDLLAEHRPVMVRGSTSMRNEEVTIRIEMLESPVSVNQ